MKRKKHPREVKGIVTSWLKASLGAPVLVFALGIGAAAAQSSGPGRLMPESCKQPKPLIGVALPNISNPYYIAMRQSFLDHGKEAGFNMEVSIADNSDSRQLSQVDAFIQQKVCAVALNAVGFRPGCGNGDGVEQGRDPGFHRQRLSGR